MEMKHIDLLCVKPVLEPESDFAILLRYHMVTFEDNAMRQPTIVWIYYLRHIGGYDHQLFIGVIVSNCVYDGVETRLFGKSWMILFVPSEWSLYTKVLWLLPLWICWRSILGTVWQRSNTRRETKNTVFQYDTYFTRGYNIACGAYTLSYVFSINSHIFYILKSWFLRLPTWAMLWVILQGDLVKSLEDELVSSLSPTNIRYNLYCKSSEVTKAVPYL